MKEDKDEGVKRKYVKGEQGQSEGHKEEGFSEDITYPTFRRQSLL